MKPNQQIVAALGASKLSRQMRRAARFAPGGSIRMRFGGRMMLLVWRTRARMAQLLDRLLSRSLRQVALRAVVGTVALSSLHAAATVSMSSATLPSGASFKSGDVALNYSANALTVKQNAAVPAAIINWNNFDIGASGIVKFDQPAGGSILNRVTGLGATSILGNISANGKVWIINPAGIMIGSGATINVAGFVASSLQVSDSDFLANRLNFTGGAGAGPVTNYGSIATSDGGHVYLVGAHVANVGSISPNSIDPIASTSASALLAAGDAVTITLADATLPGIKVDVTGTTGTVNNIGQIVSRAGSIGLAAAFVNNNGTLDVSRISSVDGKIFLQAANTAAIYTGSVISTGAGGELRASGALRIDGAALDLGGGALTASGPVVVNNASLSNLTMSAPGLVTFSGVDALNANVSLPNAAITSGATLSGSGKLTATNLNWLGGTIMGSSTDPAYDITNLTMTDMSTLDGRTLNLVAGGNSSANGATLLFKNSGVLNNAGTLTISDQSQLGYFKSPQARNSAINNTGIINSTNTPQGIAQGYTGNYLGGGYDATNAIAFNNAGVVNLTDGELHVTGGGTHTGSFNVTASGIGKTSTLRFGIYNYDFTGAGTEHIEAGAVFTESGIGGGIAAVDFSTSRFNTTNLNANLKLDNVVLTNGTLQGSGKLTATNLNWAGGTIAGRQTDSLVDPSYDITNLVLRGYEILRGRTLNLVAGGQSTAAGATLSMQNRAVLNNAGNLTIADGAALGNRYDINSQSGLINNSGVMTATNSTGLFFGDSAPNSVGAAGYYGGVAFSNAGTLDVQSGTLQLNSPAALNNQGQIQVGAGATLSSNNDLINAQSAKISGAGTIALNQHTLINNGMIAPGSSTSTGTLTINGNYTQGSTGEFDAKISGGDVVQNDQLIITGVTKLDGQLSVSGLNGYVPKDHDSSTLMNSGTNTQTLGKFARVSLPDYLIAGYGLSKGAAVSVNYVPGGTNFFSNAAHDLDWNNADNWSLNYTPISVSDVLINTGFTVQHASGDDKIRSLTVNASNGLNISGGSLAVSGLSSVSGKLTVGAAGSATLGGGLTGSGTLAIDGGNVQLGAASTIANLAMTGGTLAGVTDFTVSNSLQQIGGTLQFAGAKVDLHQSSGDLLINNLTAATTNLAATSGAIVQTGDALTLGALTTQSATGTRLDNAANQITRLSALNTGSGDIAVASAGALALGSISNTAGVVSLSAGGTITQDGAISGTVLTTSSIGGTTLNGANRVSSLSALNTGSGDISVVNTTRPDTLTVLAMKNTAGSIAIDNTGAILTSGALDAAGGTLKLTAHSPITVNSALTARDGITLTALPSVLGIDTVAINGTLASTTGNILVSSGTNTTVGSTATLQVTPGSVIALTAVKGEVDVINGATFVGAQPTITQSVVALVAPPPPAAPQLPLIPPPAPPPPAAPQLPLIPPPAPPQLPLMPPPAITEPSIPQPSQSVTINTIDSLQKTATPFGISTTGPTLLASLTASSDVESGDSGSGSGAKKTDGAESGSDGSKSKSDKPAKSLPVCN